MGDLTNSIKEMAESLYKSGAIDKEIHDEIVDTLEDTREQKGLDRLTDRLRKGVEDE